jgi:pilus assembly protein CpaB
MAQGEIILASKVSGFGEKVTIVQRIKDGHRAMAINVNATTSAGGFVTPGDFVDVLMTEGSGGGLATYTILQSILVIGVDQNANEQSDAPQVARTVTVEVTPEQGQKLALAQQAGRLSLSLRSLENEEDKPLESVRLVDILNAQSPVEDDAPKSIVRVRRGVDAAEEITIRPEALN